MNAVSSDLAFGVSTPPLLHDFINFTSTRCVRPANADIFSASPTLIDGCLSSLPATSSTATRLRFYCGNITLTDNLIKWRLEFPQKVGTCGLPNIVNFVIFLDSSACKAEVVFLAQTSDARSDGVGFSDGSAERHDLSRFQRQSAKRCTQSPACRTTDTVGTTAAFVIVAM